MRLQDKIGQSLYIILVWVMGISGVYIIWGAIPAGWVMLSLSAMMLICLHLGKKTA